MGTAQSASTTVDLKSTNKQKAFGSDKLMTGNWNITFIHRKQVRICRVNQEIFHGCC